MCQVCTKFDVCTLMDSPLFFLANAFKLYQQASQRLAKVWPFYLDTVMKVSRPYPPEATVYFFSGWPAADDSTSDYAPAAKFQSFRLQISRQRTPVFQRVRANVSALAHAYLYAIFLVPLLLTSRPTTKIQRYPIRAKRILSCLNCARISKRREYAIPSPR